MLNLPTTTSALQVVTGSAVTSIGVHASAVDLGPGPAVTVPGPFNTPITVAGTTVVVPPPAAGVDRNVKFLSINNQSVSTCSIAVQIADGVNTINLFGPVLLKPAWTIQYNSDGSGFVVYDDKGDIQVSPSSVILVSNLNISAGTTSNNLAAVTFANSNGISFGLNASTITASFEPGVKLSAGTTSNLASAFTFANRNGVSFGLDAGTLTASVATSLTSVNISAGTTSQNLSNVVFSNANNVSFGLAGSVVTASATVLSTQGSLNLSAGTTSNLASAFTFSNSNGISFGLNAGTLTASGGVGTISVFSQDADFVTNAMVNQAALSLQKLSLPMNLSATQLALIADFSGFSNSSGAITISHAVYTMSGGTAILASSGFRAISWTSGSDTSASSRYGGASGTRYRTLSVSYGMTPGDYLFGWLFSTANDITVKAFGGAAMNLVGTFDGVETGNFLDGTSVSTVAAFPSIIAASDTGYARTGFSALLQPGAILFGTH